MRATEFTNTNGITHLEDLSPDGFLSFMDSLINGSVSITEKMDGSAIGFGLDENGNFYTDRATRDSERFYSHDDWPNEHWCQGFKAAHMALSLLSEKMEVGQHYDGEMLFGGLPNVVPYSTDVNRVIIFDESFSSKLTEDVYTVEMNMLLTEDGKTTKSNVNEFKWQFETVPVIDKSVLVDIVESYPFKQKLADLKRFLNARCIREYTYYEVLNMKLNKRPDGVDAEDWKTLKPLIKEYRDGPAGANFLFEGHKGCIKEVLLDSLVRGLSSKFGPSVEDGGWIEGVVFKEDERYVKLVDKKVFTTIKEWAWSERNRVSGTPESFVSKLRQEMADASGYSILGGISANRWIKEQGNTRQERVNNIAAMIDMDTLKDKWNAILVNAVDELGKLLDGYKERRDNLHTTINVGAHTVELEHTGEIDYRTLTKYAQTFSTIMDQQDAIARTRTPQELVEIWLGGRLG